METTKLLEAEKEDRNSIHLYWNGTDGTWNACGKSAENAMRINPELRTLTDKAELDDTQVTHLRATTEQLEECGLADHCVAVDNKHLKLKLKN